MIRAIGLGLMFFLGSSAVLGAQTLPATFMAAAPVTTPEAAVQEAVRTGGVGYAGDCAGTTPANIGQDCSRYAGDNGVLRAYLVGLSFSEYTDWVFIAQTPAGWVPLSSASFDDSAGGIAIPWPSVP